MDRQKVNFRLLAGLKWSDGSPLTAADSVFSYNLAADPATKVTKRVIDRTVAYQATDDQTIEWTGRPGYAPQNLAMVFFTPLPKHAWQSFKPGQMEALDEVARKPLGWGPFVVQEWKAGDHIRLVKNPNYFRSSEGLPKFDVLVYRFLGEPGDNNLAALQSGECDVVDQTTLLEDQLRAIIDLQNAKKLKVYIGQGPAWEHLDFGIRPAAYDDGFNAGKDRPDFFSDVRVRQAVAQCINRPAIVQDLLFNRSVVPASYLPPDHPLALKDLKPLAYDVASANKLLTEAGWKDQDNNPATPRTAQGIANVPNGTPMVLQYVTSEAAMRVKTAELVKRNLADCGIEVKVSQLNLGQLYASGPGGVLFGRNFDLAQFSWDPGSQSPCVLYETSGIPTAKNSWVGGNLIGYSSPAFDAACKSARQSRPDSAAYASASQEATRLLAKDIPTIPLYFPLEIAISRPDFCNLEMDVSARSFLWNLEAYDTNAACKPQ
jgi:peptide/nickel transport system substrate-binding protein